MLDLFEIGPPLYDLDNPARSFIEEGAPDFGYTEVTYNNQSALIRRSGRGGLAPISVSAPTLQVTALPPGHAYNWRATIQTQEQHDIGWRIHLPPRPRGQYWSHMLREGARLWSLLDRYLVKRPDVFANGTEAWLRRPELMRLFTTPPGPWEIRMYPGPNVDAFMGHILAHEYQHVEDHAWLANAIIGPLDDWHAAHAGTTFFAYEKSNLYGVILAGYAETYERILRYWQNAIVDSGDLFHNSPQGAHPVMRIVNIQRENRIGEPGLIEIEVEPQTRMIYWGFDLDDPDCHPERFAGGDCFRITNGKLGGNEPAITRMSGAPIVRQVNFGTPVVGGVLVDTNNDDGIGFNWLEKDE